MLEPEVLDYILNSLSVHKQLQESIIRDIVRRIVKGGLSPADNLTETAAYQAEILQKAGIVYDDIVKLVAESSDALYYDIKTAFDSAEVEIFNFDDEVLLSNGYEPETVKKLSPEMKQMWEASLSKTFTEAENLTKTIALTSQNAYISACDLAHMQVASGSFTYSQAIANAAKQASIQGTKVLYASGAVANLDYAVRRSVLTGVNQTAANLMFSKAQELEHDLMQTTAHYGARPEHSLWQGCVVSLSGRAGYHSLDYVGYGTVTGIFGANCKHNWYMYFGFSPYTPEMLEDMKNKTVTVDGQEIPMYDALQKQRRLERSVKTTKRELIGLDEAMKNVSAKDAVALKAEFQAGAVKLKRQEARIADFCKQTGLKRDRFREQVFSAETENGIKSWTKSVSQKAIMANRNVLTNKFGNGTIKAGSDVMYRKSAIGKIEPMPKKQFRRIEKGFKRNGGKFFYNDDIDNYLAQKQVEGITYNETTVLLRKKPSRASVFEELIHATQYKNGENNGSYIDRLKCEIKAQEKLLSHSSAYQLTPDEIKQTERALEAYKKDLREYTKNGGV